MKKVPNIDFIGHRKIYFIISGVLMAVIVLATIVLGVDLDIRFKGGTIISYTYSEADGKELDLDAVEKTAEDVLGMNVSVDKKFSLLSDTTSFDLVLTDSINIEDSMTQSLTDKLNEEHADYDIAYSSITTVDANMGSSFLAKCLVAVIFGILIMTIYIAIRFRLISGWSAGVTAVIALIHDMFVVFGVFVIFRIGINDSFIAVILTILGYSANDTVIIYDRIRENKRLYAKTKDLKEIVNLSVNQTLSRSIHTSISTILTMLIVVVVAVLFGVTSILSFAFPMIIGLIAGSYSSICIASPLWYEWQMYKEKHPKKAKTTKKKKK